MGDREIAAIIGGIVAILSSFLSWFLGRKNGESIIRKQDSETCQRYIESANLSIDIMSKSMKNMDKRIAKLVNNLDECQRKLSEIEEATSLFASSDDEIKKDIRYVKRIIGEFDAK